MDVIAKTITSGRGVKLWKPYITKTEDRRAEEDRVSYRDVRSGSVKIIASEVGEGSIAIRFVHQCS
jgi:hypothetical protein